MPLSKNELAESLTTPVRIRSTKGAFEVTRTRARIRDAASSPAWAGVGLSGGARILILPISAALGIVNTRLIIGHFGEGAFAQYGLLVGIGSLLPFADLGMAAAIVNAIGESEDPANDPRVRRVMTTALRILFGSFMVLALASVVIAGTGSWRRLLGGGLLPDSGPTAATLCGLLIATTMLVAYGQRALVGLGKNHVTVALSGLQTPFVVLTVLALIALGAPLGGYVAVAAYAATFFISVAACWWAGRILHPAMRSAIRDAWRLRTVRGGRVFDVAWPMLVQMIALPIAMQTDRLVLSHLTDVTDLAEYNLAAQIFTPVWAVVSSAGAALWPIFARARAQRERAATSPLRLSAGFGLAAAVVCVVLSVLSPWLASVSSGGQIQLSVALVVVFSIFMVAQALKYPLGMYMTDARGLRFQAYMILVLLPLNLALSLWLTDLWGTVGPVFGSMISVLICQVLANWIYVRRALKRDSSAAPRADADMTAQADSIR